MKRNKGLKRSDQRKLEDKIRELIGKDFSDQEIMEVLDLQPHVLRLYRQRILEADMTWLRSRSAEDIFGEYVRQAGQWVKDLDMQCKLFRKHGQETAYVHAIRQRRRIHAQVIKMGQDLGIIPKNVMHVQVQGMTFRKIGNTEQHDKLNGMFESA